MTDCCDVRVRLVGPSKVLVQTLGIQGPSGEDGSDGSQWHQNSGPPPEQLGQDGDFYLDVSTSNVYQKAAGTWSLVANIQGEPGTGGGGTVTVPTANKGMVAEVTSAPYQLACSTPIAFTPANDSAISIEVNGVGYGVGDGVRTNDFYFSQDGGLTPRLIADVEAGDLLYQGSGLAFSLDALDLISFTYIVDEGVP